MACSCVTICSLTKRRLHYGGAGLLSAASLKCHLKMWPFVIGVMSLLSPPQIVFEAVTSGQRGLLAIKDIVVKGHQCSKFFFFPVTIKEYHQRAIVLSMTPPIHLYCCYVQGLIVKHEVFKVCATLITHCKTPSSLIPQNLRLLGLRAPRAVGI